MAATRGKQREFISHYLGLSIGPLRVPRSVKNRIAQVSHVVIDTQSLTDGKLHYGHTWSLSGATPHETQQTAARALTGSTGDAVEAIVKALPTHDNPAFNPVAHTSGRRHTATWHHGKEYDTYWLSDVADIVAHASLTENERERALLEAQKATSRGMISYAVGQSRTSAIPKQPGHAIELTGLIFFYPELYPGTAVALEKLRQADVTILYASRDNEHTVSTLAHLSCLASQHTVPCTTVPPRAINYPLFARLSDTDKARLLRQLPDDSYLVVDQPIQEFCDVFMKLRA